MLIRDQGQRSIRHGSSLSDVANYVRAERATWTLRDSFTNAARPSWDLGVGLAGAEQLMTKGWQEGVRKISTHLATLPPTPNRHADEKYDVGGYYPDVARFLGGAPDHMVTKGKRMGNPPVMQLVVNGSASSAITAQEMANYGSAMVALIDQLESQGHRVELDVVFKTVTQGTLIVGWKVKQAGEHVDLADVAFSLAHPAALRRIAFALYERASKAFERSGYGMATGCTRADLEVLELGDAILVNGIQNANGACTTLESAIKFAKAQVGRAYREYTGQDLFEEN